MTRSPTPIRVLIDTPFAFIRPRNTDWRYMKMLAGLSHHEPLNIRYPASMADAAAESAHYLAQRAGFAVGKGPALYQRPGRWIAREAHWADIVLTHRRFPLGVDRPVVWQHSVLDPCMRTARGEPASAVAKDYADQAPSYEAAAGVQVATHAEARRHASTFPAIGGRFHATPFFLPHIVPIPAQNLLAKHRDDAQIRILFVGREARRKGLDLLLDALISLPADLLARTRLDIVSTFSGGKIAIPSSRSIHVHSALPGDGVLKLMRDAHIFAMPSRFESYGFTYIEAMANGCAVIGPHWEVQSEILGNGEAGLAIAPTPDAIREALARLAGDREARTGIARNALERWRAEYAPEKVARAYYEMIESALSTR